jgi:hypothetical protein
MTARHPHHASQRAMVTAEQLETHTALLTSGMCADCLEPARSARCCGESRCAAHMLAHFNQHAP